MVVAIFIVISGWGFFFGLFGASEEQVFEALEDADVVAAAVIDPVGVGHDDDAAGENGQQDGHHDGQEHEGGHQVDNGRHFRARNAYIEKSYFL